MPKNVEVNDNMEEKNIKTQVDMESSTSHTEAELDSQEEAPEKTVEDLIESLKQELLEAEDKKMRAFAELENFKARTQKETEAKIKHGNQSLLLGFLPILDNLELALKHADGSGDVDSIKEGVQLTLKQFVDTLDRFGISQINLEVGDVFNPNLHDALMLDNNSEYEDNVVTELLQKGYTLHERVVRPSKVKVNKIVEKIEKNKGEEQV